MTEEEERYFAQVDEFDQLISIVWESASVLATVEVETDQQSYASILYDKLAAHACSLSRLLPRRDLQPGLIWDVSSVSAIARCIMDAYGALAYLSLDDISTAEQEFRLQLLALHDWDRRLQVTKALGSDQEVVETINTQLAEIRENLKKCEFFLALSPKEQERLLEEPRDFHKTRRERNKASGVDDDFYLSAWIYLSQFIHSHGFALHQLHNPTARTSDAYRLMGVPLAFATAFLAKGIQGVHRLFKLDEATLSPEDQDHLHKMALMTNGFNVQFE